MRIIDRKITYSRGDQDFLRALNDSVAGYFKKTGKDKYGNRYVHLKSVCMFVVYLAGYGCIYLSSSYTALLTSYIVMGPLAVFLALNIGHEAAHQIFCKNKKLNDILVYIFDFMGASSQIWKYKHVHSHHQHTNIYEVDLELKQPNIVRIFPQSAYRFFHRYQQFYMPVLYSFYTVIWFCNRDFKDFWQLRTKMSKGYPIKELLVFVAAKCIYLSRMLILPILLTPFSWTEILIAFVVSNMVSSITVTFALISTHVGEHSAFPEPDEEGQLGHSWVKHQFMTTSDFATDNRVVTALYGGFNHHLTHHLFPYVSHVHYPKLTKIIKRVSRQYGIVSYPQPTIARAITSHFTLLGRRAKEGKGQLEWMEM